MYFHNVVGTGSYTTSTTNMYHKDFTYHAADRRFVGQAAAGTDPTVKMHQQLVGEGVVFSHDVDKPILHQHAQHSKGLFARVVVVRHVRPAAVTGPFFREQPHRLTPVRPFQFRQPLDFQHRVDGQIKNVQLHTDRTVGARGRHTVEEQKDSEGG
jgi:hypothetical protein